MIENVCSTSASDTPRKSRPKALSLDIPAKLLALADEVIE